MLFHNRRKQVSNNFEVKIAGKCLSLVNSTKFLGIIIDSKLTWEGHINFIRKKIAKGIGIIHRARNSLNSESLLTLYYSFLYPYINYGIEVWGSVPSTNLLNILKLQKKALRLLSFSPFSSPSEPLFQKYKMLKVQEIFIYKIALFMYKLYKGECPSKFSSMFVANNHYHYHATRQHHKLHLPFFNTNFCQAILRYKGAII